MHCCIVEDQGRALAFGWKGISPPRSLEQARRELMSSRISASMRKSLWIDDVAWTNGFAAVLLAPIQHRYFEGWARI